jgi:trigger factor
VNVTFPEEYHAAELAGKAATFKVTLKAITKIELPELDDDFAKDVSEFDTFAEYRADIAAKILKRHENAAESVFEETIVKALNEKLGGEEIPEGMIEAEVENQVRDFDNRLRMQGMDMGMYFKYTGMTLEGMRDQMRPQAETFVKTRLALEKIAELENLTATEEEIEAEYTRLSEAYGMEAEQVKGMIPAESISEDLRVKAAMELVKANAVAPATAE